MMDVQTQQQLAQIDELLRLGYAQQAKPLLKRLLKTQPKLVDGLYRMVKAQRMLKEWPEAIATGRKLYSMAPGEVNHAEELALALTLSNEGRHVIAAMDIKREILRDHAHYPNAAGIAANIATLALRSDEPQRVYHDVRHFFEAVDVQGPERLRLSASIAVAAYILGDDAVADAYTALATGLRHLAYDADDRMLAGDYPFLYMYASFIRLLLDYRLAHAEYFAAADVTVGLHAIGESHCLSTAHLKLANGARVQSHLLMGVKAYAFTQPYGEAYQFHLRRMFQALPKAEPVVVIFGEIDCRPGEGIMAQWMKTPGYDMEREVATLTEEYVRFVKKAQLRRLAPTYIYGVPAASPKAKRHLPAERCDDFARMLRLFNEGLAVQAQKQELPFIDIHYLTVGDDGWAKEGMHIDEVHVKPEIVARAFARFIK
jgi:lysophospholipase L1-like esterase